MFLTMKPLERSVESEAPRENSAVVTGSDQTQPAPRTLLVSLLPELLTPHLYAFRTMVTLRKVLSLVHRGTCCPGHAIVYRSTIAYALALPGFTFGLDRLIQVGKASDP